MVKKRENRDQKGLHDKFNLLNTCKINTYNENHLPFYH